MFLWKKLHSQISINYAVSIIFNQTHLVSPHKLDRLGRSERSYHLATSVCKLSKDADMQLVDEYMKDNTITTKPIRIGASVLGTFIDALDWNDVIATILSWGTQRQSASVCLCNVHSAVTAVDDPALASALRTSEMVLPDGAPIAWFLRRKGFRQQTRIAGPDLMLRLCETLQHTLTSVFLFGSSENTMLLLRRNLNTRFPNLAIAGTLSPRFGDWTKEEESRYVDAIRSSGAGIIFVGLGCPKQEIWMSRYSREIPGVLLGVGAAFDFHAGNIRRAPVLFQKAGLEWLHRLLSEPRRLWKRYLITNTRFILLSIRELFTRPEGN